MSPHNKTIDQSWLAIKVAILLFTTGVVGAGGSSFFGLAGETYARYAPLWAWIPAFTAIMTLALGWGKSRGEFNEKACGLIALMVGAVCAVIAWALVYRYGIQVKYLVLFAFIALNLWAPRSLKGEAKKTTVAIVLAIVGLFVFEKALSLGIEWYSAVVLVAMSVGGGWLFVSGYTNAATSSGYGNAVASSGYQGDDESMSYMQDFDYKPSSSVYLDEYAEKVSNPGHPEYCGPRSDD
jgi:hypothetical protein